MTKGDLLYALECFEDDVEIKLSVPYGGELRIFNLTTDGRGTVFIVGMSNWAAQLQEDSRAQDEAGGLR